MPLYSILLSTFTAKKQKQFFMMIASLVENLFPKVELSFQSPQLYSFGSLLSWQHLQQYLLCFAIGPYNIFSKIFFMPYFVRAASNACCFSCRALMPAASKIFCFLSLNNLLNSGTIPFWQLEEGAIHALLVSWYCIADTP